VENSKEECIVIEIAKRAVLEDGYKALDTAIESAGAYD
jgi:hypothetical protein